MINRVTEGEGQLNIALQRHKGIEYIKSNLSGKQYLHHFMNKNTKYDLNFFFKYILYIYFISTQPFIL